MLRITHLHCFALPCEVGEFQTFPFAPAEAEQVGLQRSAGLERVHGLARRARRSRNPTGGVDPKETEGRLTQPICRSGISVLKRTPSCFCRLL